MNVGLRDSLAQVVIIRQFATGFDVALIAAVLWLAFTYEGFVGGFGWFLLLGLSPRAWR